jgi:hypothetical protein
MFCRLQENYTAGRGYRSTYALCNTQTVALNVPCLESLLLSIDVGKSKGSNDGTPVLMFFFWLSGPLSHGTGGGDRAEMVWL